MGIGSVLLEEELAVHAGKFTDNRSVLQLYDICAAVNMLDIRHTGDVHRMGRTDRLQQIIVGT